MKKNGNFVISLDFELMWGVLDSRTIDSYGKNIAKVNEIIPRLIVLFEKYEIKATFSTVGLLFYESFESRNEIIPKIQPRYDELTLSPYYHWPNLALNNKDYFSALKLIKLIQQHPMHEIGTHTYCHYYCLEPGQDENSFRADLAMAKKIASKYECDLKSIVFPRNQYNSQYLNTCKDAGIVGFRGNEDAWIYRASRREKQGLFKRLCRLLDAYINLSGHNTFLPEKESQSGLYNIKASRFLRPYSKKFRFFEKRRLKRIKKSMLHAAKNGETFHLWWHPHNFGSFTDENFDFLEQLLVYQNELKEKYNMNSHSMKSLIYSLHES